MKKYYARKRIRLSGILGKPFLINEYKSIDDAKDWLKAWIRINDPGSDLDEWYYIVNEVGNIMYDDDICITIEAANILDRLFGNSLYDMKKKEIIQYGLVYDGVTKPYYLLILDNSTDPEYFGYFVSEDEIASKIKANGLCCHLYDVKTLSEIDMDIDITVKVKVKNDCN